jgi:ribosome-associated protein
LSTTASTAKKTALKPERIAALCAEFAANKKAEEIVALDLRGISSLTDFFVICSGTSEPHLKAIAGEIEDQMRKEHDLRPHNVDGYPTSQWIIVDYYDVLVHIFHSEKRAFYALEDLWSDAPRLKLKL